MKLEKNSWWGNRPHRLFTVAIFIVLASLDNAARAVVPPLYAVIAADLGVTDASLGFVTALSIIVVAITALIWGYWGDRGSRKMLLLYGTIIWSVSMFLTSVSQTYLQLMIFQLLTAVGIGCIASVGFSIVTDLIAPRRRGLLMSFWGLSQAGGGGFGALVGSMLGASNWRLPFVVIAIAGTVFALLYLFTYEPRRGQSEPELSKLFESGERYGRRIRFTDLKKILRTRSNLWLILQGFVSTIAFGSLVWMPSFYISHLETLGYPLETATISGNILSLMMQLGLYASILGGYLGDRWQRRNLAARAWICTIGSLSAIPFLLAFFFVPLPEFYLPADATTGELVWTTLMSVFTNRWVAIAFVLSFIGFGLMSLDAPNRSALLSDINQPEHRGTIAGFSTLLVGAGLALGNSLTGVTQTMLAGELAPPLNYATGLALFQLFFLPAAYFYYRTTRSSPSDIARSRKTLARRAQQSIDERITEETQEVDITVIEVPEEILEELYEGR